MKRILLIVVWLSASLFFLTTHVFAQQHVTLAGKIVDEKRREAVPFSTVLLKEHNLWSVSDERGAFAIHKIPVGKVTMEVHCLGYATQKMELNLTADRESFTIILKEENLTLEGVKVVAEKKVDEATTSYLIDRTTLDNQQILNVSNIASLLPGGKTVNATLISDNRLSLRSESSEKGNASFGTAIEVDGQRIDNNSAMDETVAASMRNVSISDIENVEIITGIPSVEYGDLNNGIVRIKMRQGKTPFIVEGKINQHTRQLAVSRGFVFGKKSGVLNTSLEHARSFSDIASPYTAYQRNILSMRYSNTFMQNTTPMTLKVGISGNIGGYNSKADPDQILDPYTKVKDNMFRTNLEMRLLLNKSWVTNLTFKGSFSYQDKKAEYYTTASSASSQPYIHSREEGYFIAQDYDTNPEANIILGPTGYWYVRNWNDQKPINLSLQLKYEWNSKIGALVNRLMAGADFKTNGNNGRGTYYQQMRYAPTWREYRYDKLPWMTNYAFFVEDKLTLHARGNSSLQLTLGLRTDITAINGSEYGNAGSLSPRFSGRYIFWQRKEGNVSSLSVRAGWGKSVKLPSFQVLYPQPSYSDVLAFTPGSTWDNKAYYAYYTYVSNPIHNSNLKWQYTHQIDLGFEANVCKTNISVSAFYHKTFNPYMAVVQYSPFAYKITGQAAIEASGVASANRRYSIDKESGIVTLYDASGEKPSQQLAYSERLSYNSTRKYINGSPVRRYGVEWIVDFAQIKALSTSVRIDGNFYSYKGVDETLIPANTSGVGTTDNPAYPLIGYYRGSSSTSTSTTASATVSNGSESKSLNINLTISTHIPKIRLIMALRIESSLLNYTRSLSENKNGIRAFAVEGVNDLFGKPYDKSVRNKYVAVYPEYYSTWNHSDKLIPFAEKFLWARDNDAELFNQLSRLVIKTNYRYVLNPDRLSCYYSANFTLTKEIGEHINISFYANNFFNNMGSVRSSRTGLRTSLFSSGYIPGFYYGLSLKLKI